MLNQHIKLSNETEIILFIQIQQIATQCWNDFHSLSLTEEAPTSLINLLCFPCAPAILHTRFIKYMIWFLMLLLLLILFFMPEKLLIFFFTGLQILFVFQDSSQILPPIFLPLTRLSAFTLGFHNPRLSFIKALSYLSLLLDCELLLCRFKGIFVFSLLQSSCSVTL